MNERTLKDKLEDEQAVEHRLIVQLLIVPVLLVFFSVTSSILLGIYENLAGSFGLMATIGLSFFGISMIWIPFNKKQSFPDLTWPQRFFVLSGLFLVIPQVIVIGLIVTYGFNSAFIAIVLLYEILFYLLYTSIGALPGSRISFWFAILCILGLAGYLISLSTLTIELSGVIVEIIGAFIGVFAAITLGELLKESEDLRRVRKLRNLILEELQEIEQQLLDGVTHQIPIPVWMSALADGSILKLPSDFRKRATQSHTDIHNSNLRQHAPESRKNALESIRQVID